MSEVRHVAAAFKRHHVLAGRKRWSLVERGVGYAAQASRPPDP